VIPDRALQHGMAVANFVVATVRQMYCPVTLLAASFMALMVASPGFRAPVGGRPWSCWNFLMAAKMGASGIPVMPVFKFRTGASFCGEY
jgi:hypothetical protein